MSKIIIHKQCEVSDTEAAWLVLSVKHAMTYIPDPIERMEAAAEAACFELGQPDGKFKCYECDAIFDAEKEGGTISPHPMAMPVCGTCFEKAYREHLAKEANGLP